MRIGFFTDTYRPSLNGVVISMESFAAEMHELGCDVVLFAPRDPRLCGRPFPSVRRPSPTLLRQTGIEQVHWVPSLRSVFGPQHRMGLPFLHRLQRIARRMQLDLIHTQTPFQIGYAGVQVARSLAIPLVHTYHTHFAEYVHYLRAGARLGRLAVPRYSRWICNLHDLVLTPSRDIRTVLRLYGVRRPIELCMTGVQLPTAASPGEEIAARTEIGLPVDGKVLLYVGRLAREKNLELLLTSLERLQSLVPDVHLLLVGDGPDRARLERLAAEMGLGARVHCVGWVPHDRLRPWFLAADLFVQPSMSETQGLSLLEAMAHARPVVATRGPGVRELIRSGVNGLLVDPAPQLLAGAIHSLLDDPVLSTRLADQARVTADHLDARKQARRLVHRYRVLVHDGQRTARRGLRGLAARAREEAAAWR